MKKVTSPLGIQTYTSEEITLDLEPSIYQQWQMQRVSLPEFMPRFTQFVAMLEREKAEANINPYPEKFNRGIYILGKREPEFGIFPQTNLVLKCSEGRWGAENPRKQFFRSVQLAWEFETRLTDREKALLKICPVYLHWQIKARNALFKRVLVMPEIEGTPMGQLEIGFNQEFCQTFDIPDVKQILRKFRFSLHRFLDPKPKRQLLKIQSAYLFQRLLERGISILSLNQKNILVTFNQKDHHTQYVIIDPIADYYLPISPLYNLLTGQLCRLR